MKLRTLGREYRQLANLAAKHGVRLEGLPHDFGSVIICTRDLEQQLAECNRVRNAFDVVHAFDPDTYPSLVRSYSRLNTQEGKIRADLDKDVDLSLPQEVV